MLVINSTISIDPGEIHFTASRSAGPGGQNVNKVSSRMTLRFDVNTSPSLTAEQKMKLHERLPTRINKAGVLWVSSQRERSQARNRDLAQQRFVELLRMAFDEAPNRKPTKQPRWVDRKRLNEKKRQSQRKRDRRTTSDE